MQLQPSFTEGPVGRTLFVKTLPMVAGILALVAYNLADTIFVAHLDKGTGNSHYLAAMGFIFPVVMLIISVSLGLGTGVSSVISRTIGSGNLKRVRRLTTHSLILALLVVIFFATIGLLTMDPVFRLLGATPETIPLIKQYMNIWYAGVIFIVIPMVGNNAIRASGDMKIPGLIMCVGSVLNIVLDPIMIFGWWGFPKMGIAGAALATVISRAVATCFSLWVLYHHKKMLEVSRKVFHKMFDSWGRITYIAVPAAATTILFPLSLGVLTRLAADIGGPVVAAVGAGNRVLAFAMIPIWALGSTLGPFVGQNWGAKNAARAKRAAMLSCGFCIV
ncbi:MAG: MATE family efflux transporter, partial [Phycisphaerae bacterium]|nr:MATE family efflux transporter [Phycisphaerae bacterium]